MHPATSSLLTAEILAAQGFSPVEIARLQELRDRYHPFREYCATNREFERLAFLKWRYERGQSERETA